MAESADTTLSASPLARPDQLLAGIGADAWQAYNAMETTKRRHFECLGVLDEKKKNYNIDPTEQDKQLLASLLKDHDEQVTRFKDASLALKNQDAAAHTELFTYIGAVNSLVAEQRVTH